MTPFATGSPPMQKYIQADFPPAKRLVRESMTSKRKACKDLRSCLCASSPSRLIRGLKWPQPAVPSTTPCATPGDPQGASSLTRERRREMFNNRLCTISSCFYPSSTLPCPLTVAVSRNTLLLDFYQWLGFSDSLPTRRVPTSP